MIRITSIGLIILLILWIPSQALAATTNSGEDTILSVDEIIQLGLKLDVDVANARKNLSQKLTEWKQTHYAIIDEAQKDSSPFARPHSLSKDLDIRLKLPAARKSLVEAKDNIIQQQLLASDKLRKQYISTVTMMNTVSQALLNTQATANALAETKVLVKLGKAMTSDVDKAESDKQAAESELKQARLSYKSALIELGKSVGRDLEQGYSFELKPMYVQLREDTIWKIISHAENNDVKLSSAVMNRSMAEEKVKVTRQLYDAKFGSADMKVIESMFNKEMNLELFEANYEAFLAKVEKQWDGFIQLLVPIPKSLFQGEFDGIRYFDDQRYSLLVSLFELDKARKQEQGALEQLLSNLKKSYLSVKSAEEIYSQALQELEKVKREFAAAATKLKLNQISKDQYISIEEKVSDVNKSVDNAYKSYYSAIYQLDLDSSGGVSSLIQPGILPWNTVLDGLSPINSSPDKTTALTGSFKVETVIDPIISSLSLDIDPTLVASHYQLFTMDNIPITAKWDVSEPLVHLQVLLQSIQDYQVIFFKQQAPVAQASFSGIGTTGALIVNRMDSFEVNPTTNLNNSPTQDLGTVIIGTFKVAISSLTKEIAVVALASAEETGQGIYVQKADGQWIDLAQTIDYSTMVNGSSEIVDKDRIAQLQLTMDIRSNGVIESLQSNEQLQSEIKQLTITIDQLQSQADIATSKGELLELAQIMQEITTSVSKKAFLEALLNNSGEVLLLLAAWGSSQSGEPPALADDQPSEDLAAASMEANNSLEQAIVSGDVVVIELASIRYLEAIKSQLIEQSGVQNQLEALIDAKLRLEQSYDEAQRAKDMERIPIILEALAMIRDEQNFVIKQQLFVNKDALDTVIEQLAGDDLIVDSLIKQRTDTILAIIEAEKLKYAESELRLLNEAANTIAEQYAGEVVPIPTQNVISGPYQIKLDLPPVLIDGKAMIQIRPISESFGALVVWNDTDQSVTITKNGIVIVCTIGESTAYVNGVPFLMDAKPQLILGKTVVPLRFIAISLGIDVEWDQEFRTIELEDKGDNQQ